MHPWAELDSKLIQHPWRQAAPCSRCRPKRARMCAILSSFTLIQFSCSGNGYYVSHNSVSSPQCELQSASGYPQRNPPRKAQACWLLRSYPAPWHRSSAFQAARHSLIDSFKIRSAISINIIHAVFILCFIQTRYCVSLWVMKGISECFLNN